MCRFACCALVPHLQVFLICEFEGDAEPAANHAEQVEFVPVQSGRSSRSTSLATSGTKSASASRSRSAESPAS